MKKTGLRLSRWESTSWVATGIVVLIAAWWLLAFRQPDYYFPGPRATFTALAELMQTGEFWNALGTTIGRAIFGLLVSLLIGLLWGACAGVWQRLGLLFQPLLQLLLSTPPIIFVLMALVWFGTNGNSAVVLVVVLIAAPIITTATTQAVRGLDTDLLEMVRIFRFSLWQRLRHLFIPALTPPILAATTVALGMSIRVAVMAELIGTASGIGGQLHLAQINIQTPQVFAYAVILTAITFLLDLLFVQPIRSRIEAHQADTAPV